MTISETVRSASVEGPSPTGESAPDVHPRNHLNDLTAPEWIAETVSVWRQKGLGAGHPDAQIEKLHPAPFSFSDVSRLIRFFSKSGQTVLDPFVGIGSTLKAAALGGRKGIGIELSPYFAELTRQRLDQEVGGTLFDMPEQTILEGDSREVLPTLDADSVDFVVTSPPYWNILHKEDHKANQERIKKGLTTRYSEDDERDLGNIRDYDAFVEDLVAIFAECGRVLKPTKYLCAVVGDFRDKGRYRMFHADLASACEEVGYVLKGVKILYQPHKRVFPYGYPAAYVPNLHHQYILVLRNEKDG
ncbi:MAG: DNA methyltransferase [Actinomycetota bacterium]|nr:DNA methyltransferase [Actinomycetota bacterium]